MKRLLPLLCLALAALVFTGCPKNDDPEPLGSFTYDGKTYALHSLYLIGYTQEDYASPCHDCMLVGANEALVNFQLYNTAHPEVAGTYAPATWSMEENGFIISEICVGEHVLYGAYGGYEPQEGSMTVTRDGETYWIDINATVDGKAFKAHYKGPKHDTGL